MNQETLQLENSTLANWIPGDGRCNVVAPEVLFMQRTAEWLKDGSRLGIALPDGIQGNPGNRITGHMCGKPLFKGAILRQIRYSKISHARCR
jgi:hypothetical protein